MSKLNQEIVKHWQQLRQMSLDLLDQLSDKDMGKKLPFETSQTLGNQFYCMLGTQETYVDYYLKDGEWKDWSCSLGNSETPPIIKVRTAMVEADKKLITMLGSLNLLKTAGDGSILNRHLILVEHESHHQGQLINFIYAHNLPIPKSWTDKWALER